MTELPNVIIFSLAGQQRLLSDVLLVMFAPVRLWAVTLAASAASCSLYMETYMQYVLSKCTAQQT